MNYFKNLSCLYLKNPIPGKEFTWSSNKEENDYYHTEVAKLSDELNSVGLQATVKFISKGQYDTGNAFQVVISITEI